MKSILILAVTGTQGRSVLDAMADSGDWIVSGTTREPSKVKEALPGLSKPLIKANLDDYDSLVSAFKGQDAVFAVTDFWTTCDLDAVVAQGKRLGAAAVESGVKHLVFSTLSYTAKWSKGKYKAVAFCDAEGIIADHLLTLPIPVTLVDVGLYFSNFRAFERYSPTPVTNSDGTKTYVFQFPCSSTAMIPWIDTRTDLGKFVRGVVDAGPEKMKGKTVYAATCWMNHDEIVKSWGEIHGVKVKYEETTVEGWADTRPDRKRWPFHQMAAEFYGYCNDFGYYGHDVDLTESQALAGGKGFVTWGEFVERTKGDWNL